MMKCLKNIFREIEREERKCRQKKREKRDYVIKYLALLLELITIEIK